MSPAPHRDRRRSSPPPRRSRRCGRSCATEASRAVPTETFYALAADPPKRRRRRPRLRDQGTAGRRSRCSSSLPRRSDLGPARRRSRLQRRSIGSSRSGPRPLTVVLPLRAPIAASREAIGRSPSGCRRTTSCADLLSRGRPADGHERQPLGSEPPLVDPGRGRVASFRRELDLLVDGGRTPGGQPSTLLDATREPPRRSAPRGVSVARGRVTRIRVLNCPLSWA